MTAWTNLYKLDIITILTLSVKHWQCYEREYIFNFYSNQVNQEANSDKKQSKLDIRMNKIIERSQHESGDQSIAGAGMTPNAALQDYLSRPLCKNTFDFWRKYGR